MLLASTLSATAVGIGALTFFSQDAKTPNPTAKASKYASRSVMEAVSDLGEAALERLLTG